MTDNNWSLPDYDEAIIEAAEELCDSWEAMRQAPFNSDKFNKMSEAQLKVSETVKARRDYVSSGAHEDY